MTQVARRINSLEILQRVLPKTKKRESEKTSPRRPIFVLSRALLGSLPGSGRHQPVALLGMQLRRLDIMMKCMLTVSVSQVRVVGCLFVFLSLIVLRRLVVVVGSFLMMTRSVMVMLPSF
jgi:hypothetical protein